jgi:hypothetical protein
MIFWSWFKKKELPRLEIKDMDGNLIFVRPWSCLVARNLSNQIFINADFNGSDLSDANCRGTKFLGCKFVGAKLRHADLRGAVLNFCDLSRADLTGARVNQADLLNTSFGNRTQRTDMSRVERLDEALIDRHELIYKGKFDTLRGRKYKDVPQNRAVRKARIEYHASRPLVPRSLLALNFPLGRHAEFEHAPVARKPGRRRTRYPRKGSDQPAPLSLLQQLLPRKGQA